MRTLLVALVFAAAPAAAQAAPGACDVTISRAPAEVRAAVEHWLAAEARCSVALELRVVPTQGGYDVLARDEDGTIRERVVPDAQSAGVLVASWAADDGIRRRPSPFALAAFDGDGSARPSPDLAARPPGLTRTAARAEGVRAPEPLDSKWLGLDATDVVNAHENGAGLRAELDLATRGRWAIGASASLTTSHQTQLPPPAMFGSIEGSFAMLDAKLLAYASGRAQWGGWHVRAAVGAGFVLTRGQTFAYDSLSGMSQTYTAQGVFPTAEAALVLGHSLGRKLAFEIGPVGSLYAQRFHFEFNFDAQSQLAVPYVVSRDPVQWALVAGLRYRL